MVKEIKLEKSRKNGFTEDIRTGWFNKLNEVLVKYDLLYKPLQIFNMDKSGFSDETCCKYWFRSCFSNSQR